MAKRTVLAVVLIFILWFLLDYLLHGFLLRPTYGETQELWRPEGERKYWLVTLANLVTAVTFVVIYAAFFAVRSVTTGLLYGLLFGVGIGITTAYVSYAVMPIPYHLALTWFLSALVKTLLAGGIMGGLIQPHPKTKEASGEAATG